jgi:hypothetical protein
VSKDELNRREPPLITACRMHFTEGVISLVNAGADIDSQDNFGGSLLFNSSLLTVFRHVFPLLSECRINKPKISKWRLYSDNDKTVAPLTSMLKSASGWDKSMFLTFCVCPEMTAIYKSKNI